MTLATIRAEVAAVRFNNTADTSRIDRWINLAYAQVWGMEDWIFRKATASPTVTAGSRTLTGTPSVGFITRGLWDDNGDRMLYLESDRFNDIYVADTSSANPQAYTVVNQTITVAPTPSESATWTMLYEKRITQLANDNSVPLLPSEFHYLLVLGAIMLGGALYSDFTSQFVEAQWDRGVEAMRADYLADTRGEPSPWGGWGDDEFSAGSYWPG